MNGLLGILVGRSFVCTSLPSITLLKNILVYKNKVLYLHIEIIFINLKTLTTMQTNIIINNFDVLNRTMQLNSFHILTGQCEGWETLFPETKVNLDKLIDLPLPENLDFYPYTLHLYSNPDQLLEDIKHNIQLTLTNFKNLGGDGSFYDYLPDRISCIIQGFKSLKPIYPKVISSLAQELSKSMLQTSEYLNDLEFDLIYIDQFIPDLYEFINQ